MTYNITSPSIPTLLHSLIPESLHPLFLLSYPITPRSNPFYSSFPIPTPFASTNSSAPRIETLYSKGPNDVLFVAFWAVAFTVLREIAMRFVLAPFAAWWLASERLGRPESEKKMSALERRIMDRETRRLNRVATRFSEQGWNVIYCSVFWTIGFVSFSLPVLPRPQELRKLARSLFEL